MRLRGSATLVKFAAFVVVMSLLTAILVMTFGQYRTGATEDYAAVFADASSLKSGDSVRVSGIRVGTVSDVALQANKKVLVEFDADRAVVLTTGTKAAVRYLNLVGDRYLELVDSPGSTRVLPAGSEIPVERTEPALDLDLLLGGLKPVVQGLNPEDVNALTSSLIQIFQGQGATVESLFSRTSSFTSALADNSQIVESLIDNLNEAVDTLNKDSTQFSATIDRVEQLVTALSAEREPLGAAINALADGTTSLASLLTDARPPLDRMVNQLNTLAPSLDSKRDRVGTALQMAPENYRKLARVGSYGAFFNYYICSMTVRVSDLQNRTAVFPLWKDENGRCAEPE